MEKKLEGLRWKPRWTSHMGCIEGCLAYLGLDVSPAWLYGGTGHAFIINMANESVCPSGPTAWHTEMLFRLGRNIGYTIEGVFGPKQRPDLAEKQRLAWENTRKALDAGLPGYGWELERPEFYVVYGYDDTGYYFSGPLCDNGKGPKPWQELGTSQIGILEMYSLRPSPPADDRQTVRQALEFALEHAQSPAKWIYPQYRAGLAAYDNWIRTLEAGQALPDGLAYNAAVWSECRGFAVEFLQEAKARLGGRLASSFDDAIAHYTVVAQNLHRVHQAFPFPPKGEIQDESRRKPALECLTAARQAESQGLKALEEIASQL